MAIQQITTGIIQDGAISVADVADGTLTGSKLAANTLANSVFQTGSVEAYMRAQGPGTFSGMRNRIINGAMVIDQRKAGASGTATGYTVDRWVFAASLTTKGTWQQNAGSVTPPAGFSSYLGFTSNSAYSVGAGDYFALGQPIEGYNVADFQWGTASAKTVTLSFWVRSSLTGTFGGSLQSANASRCYPFTYTISSANTWEQKFIQIPGDTLVSGSNFPTSNAMAFQIFFTMACGTTYAGPAGSWASSVYISATGCQSVVGTNGATFYFTGVQLEMGTQPTPFEYRQYGTELALCQRYYEKSYDLSTVPGTATSVGQALSRATAQAGGTFGQSFSFKVEKRTQPSVTTYRASDGYGGYWNYNISGSSSSSTMTAVDIATSGCRLNSGTTISAFQAVECYGHWTADAEL